MPKRLTQRQLERKAVRKAEKEARKKLSKLQKENPEEYARIIESKHQEYLKTCTRDRKERELQVNRLKKKLLEIGIEKYMSGFKRFNEISNKFVEMGENIQEDIHIEEMQGVYLIVSLNTEKDKDCSITTKNLRVN